MPDTFPSSKLAPASAGATSASPSQKPPRSPSPGRGGHFVHSPQNATLGCGDHRALVVAPGSTSSQEVRAGYEPGFGCAAWGRRLGDPPPRPRFVRRLDDDSLNWIGSPDLGSVINWSQHPVCHGSLPGSSSAAGPQYYKRVGWKVERASLTFPWTRNLAGRLRANPRPPVRRAGDRRRQSWNEAAGPSLLQFHGARSDRLRPVVCLRYIPASRSPKGPGDLRRFVGAFSGHGGTRLGARTSRSRIARGTSSRTRPSRATSRIADHGEGP
jgi:hypothetical protein